MTCLRGCDEPINIDDSFPISGGYQLKSRHFKITINIEYVLGLKWQYEQWKSVISSLGMRTDQNNGIV